MERLERGAAAYGASSPYKGLPRPSYEHEARDDPYASMEEEARHAKTPLHASRHAERAAGIALMATAWQPSTPPTPPPLPSHCSPGGLLGCPDGCRARGAAPTGTASAAALMASKSAGREPPRHRAGCSLGERLEQTAAHHSPPSHGPSPRESQRASLLVANAARKAVFEEAAASKPTGLLRTKNALLLKLCGLLLLCAASSTLWHAL